MIRDRLPIILIALLTACTSPSSSTDSEPQILSRVHALEEVADKANSGSLGCGVGSYTLVEINGDSRVVESGLDPLFVFGNVIEVSDIVAILQSRVQSYTDTTPMTGAFSSLLYVSLYVLDESRDSSWVPLVKLLRGDPDNTARRWASLILIRKAKTDASVRSLLRDITFSWEEVGEALDITEQQWPTTSAPDWINMGPKPVMYTGET